MVGVVFSKLTRPKMRAQTLLFSRNAVICQRDGQLCLLFRVGDMRKSHIIGASIRAQMIQMRVTDEGEQMPYYQHELKVLPLSITSFFFYVNFYYFSLIMLVIFFLTSEFVNILAFLDRNLIKFWFFKIKFVQFLVFRTKLCVQRSKLVIILVLLVKICHILVFQD